MSPGPGGAHNWQPMSCGPLTGLVYIPGQEISYTYRMDPNSKYVVSGRIWEWWAVSVRDFPMERRPDQRPTRRRGACPRA